MANIKNNLKIYLWVLIILLILSFHVADLTLDNLFPSKRFLNLSTWSKIDVYYSYFTTQTNVFVVIYLMWNLIVYIINKVEHKDLKVHFHLSLGIVTYITITLFIYWIAFAMGIFNPRDNDNVNGPNLVVYHWFSSVTLHGPIPIFMIINYLAFNCGKHRYSLKKHHHRQVWLLNIYPAVYLVYAFVRGEIRYATNQPLDTCYPYTFFNWREFSNPVVNWLTIFGAFIGLIILITALQYFYLWLNNKIYDHKQKKQIDDHDNYMRLAKRYRKIKVKNHHHSE